MKCKQCNKEFEPKRKTGKFCSDKCKLAYHRSVSNDEKLAYHRNDKVSVSKLAYQLVEGKVYGRQAVSYGNEGNDLIKWDTRPEPENPDDVPDPKNRCIFRRKDGSKYIIDAVGNILGFNE